jgi:hypothetical protein
METYKTLLLRPRISLKLFPRHLCPPQSQMQIRPDGRWLQAAGIAAIACFALLPLSLARSGGHTSGPSNPGPASYHERRYWDPFWEGWHPGYGSGYDSSYWYTPTPAQTTTAETRVKNYLVAVQERRRRPATHRFIAVETLRPTKKQLEDYTKKQADAKSAAAAGGTQLSDRWVSPGQLRCIMVFDTQSKQFVGSGCYVIGRLPPAGTTAKFETYSAEFVGTSTL